MEVSLHVRSPEETHATLHEAFLWETSAKLRPYLDTVGPRLEALQVTRLCFGTEFCENLLPEPEALRAVRAACQRPFTLLTPYTGDRGLAKIKALFPELLKGD